MQRRRVLAGAGAVCVGLFGGCMGAGEGIDARRIAINGSTDGTNDLGPDRTDASRSQGLELLRYEFSREGSSGGIRGVVTNRGDVDLDFIAAYARYFDDTGERIGSGFDSEAGLPVGENWQFHVRLLDTDASNVARYQLAVIDQRSSEVDPFDANVF
jgi:hypothetical protein